MNSSLVLYSREECHLCELAAGLVAEVAPELRLRTVNIDLDIKLLGRYGERVPVLYDEGSGTELGWPFDEPQLRAYLEAINA